MSSQRQSDDSQHSKDSRGLGRLLVDGRGLYGQGQRLFARLPRVTQYQYTLGSARLQVSELLGMADRITERNASLPLPWTLGEPADHATAPETRSAETQQLFSVGQTETGPSIDFVFSKNFIASWHSSKRARCDILARVGQSNARSEY